MTSENHPKAFHFAKSKEMVGGSNLFILLKLML